MNLLKKLWLIFRFDKIQDRYLMAYFKGGLSTLYGQKLAIKPIEVDVANYLINKGLVKRSDVFFKGDDLDESMNRYLAEPARTYPEIIKEKKEQAKCQRYIDRVNKFFLGEPCNDYLSYCGAMDSIKKYHRQVLHCKQLKAVGE